MNVVSILLHLREKLDEDPNADTHGRQDKGKQLGKTKISQGPKNKVANKKAQVQQESSNQRQTKSKHTDEETQEKRLEETLDEHAGR